MSYIQNVAVAINVFEGTILVVSKMSRLIMQDIRKMFRSGSSYVVAFPPSVIEKTKFRHQRTVRVRIYDDKIVIVPLW